MIAVENIELYRYEIHSLLKAFYPQESVKVFVGEPDLRKYPEPAFLRAEFHPEYMEMEIRGSSTSAPEEIICRRAEAPEGVSFASKGSLCKTTAKHMLYDMLSAITGLTLPWG